MQIDFDWEKHEKDWSAWWNHELDRPMVMLRKSSNSDKLRQLRQKYPMVGMFTAQFPLSVSDSDVIDFYTAHISETRYFGDSWPKWFPDFGPGIIAGFVGSPVKVNAETVWFEPLANNQLDSIDLHYDTGNLWFQRVYQLTRLAVERWGQQVCVGFTDLGGNCDILAHLRSTQQLLMDLYDSPEKIQELVSQTTALWLKYYDTFYSVIKKAKNGTTPWASIWTPKSCYMLQCDFSYMISPQMFERFVLPDIAQCCAKLDHSFYHLDGKGQVPHLNMLLDLKELDGIQWIPGEGVPPASEWLELLENIRKAGKLCQLYVTPEGALKIKNEIGAKGFAFEIIHNDLSDNDIHSLLQQLNK